MTVTLRSEKGSALTHAEVDANFGSLDTRSLVNASTGLLSGGIISINADPTKFDVTAGNGIIVDSTDPTNILYENVSWGDVTGVDATLIGTEPTTIISINSVGGITQSPSFAMGEALRNSIQLGSIIHSDLATITGVSFFTAARPFQQAASITELMQALGVINYRGNVFSGDPAGNLKLYKSSGNSFYIGLQRDPNNPNIIESTEITAPVFISAWRDGSGGFVYNSTDTVIAGVYDDGTGGVAIPAGILTTNQWTNHMIVFSPDANLVGVIYGQKIYATAVAAQAGIATETYVLPSALDGVPVRAIMSTRGGATNLTIDTDAVFRKSSKLGEFI